MTQHQRRTTKGTINMIDALLMIYAKNLEYAVALVEGVPADKASHQPAPGMNHPAWIIGHLALVSKRVTAGFILQLDAPYPDDWQDRYGRDSTPDPDPAANDSLDDLITALRDGHALVEAHLRSTDAELLMQPTPHERFVQRFPLVGQALTYTMIGHECMHLGQLSAWRRVVGLPAVR
jgi:hypothetical protein